MSDDARARTIERIMEAVKAGDTRAINQLYALLWPLVFGYCYHRLRQAGNAEEAAQDTLLEIIRRVPEIELSAALWNYSRLVAGKHCDRQTRRHRVVTTILPDLPDVNRHDPLSEFLEREDRRRVIDALWSLSPRVRIAVMLYYLHEFRTTEIAAFLGTSVEAVKKRLSDGRNRLKGRIAMVEGVLRDFSGLLKIGNRNLQILLREFSAEDLGLLLHEVGPELRAKLERNVSQRVIERLRAVPRNGERAKEAVQRFWRTLDRMLELGKITLGPYENPPGAELPVPALVSGPDQGDREAWLRQVLHELSVKARRCGLFTLEHDAERCDDPLLREGLHALVDGVPPEQIRERLRAGGSGDLETLVEEGILAVQQGTLL